MFNQHNFTDAIVVSNTCAINTSNPWCHIPHPWNPGRGRGYAQWGGHLFAPKLTNEKKFNLTELTIKFNSYEIW